MSLYIKDATQRHIYKKKKYSLFSILLALYFCMMATDLFKIGSSGTLLKLYAIGLIAVALISLAKEKNFFDKVFLFEILFLLICLVSLFYSIHPLTSRTVFISLALNFGMIIICELVPHSDEEVEMLQRALLIGSFIVVILTLTFADYSEYGRLTISISENNADQNYLNGYVLFALGFLLYNIIIFKKYRTLKILTCVGILYFTLMTGSRGALLAEISMIVTAVTINAVRTKKKLKHIVLGIVVAILFLLIFDYLISILPLEVAKRFSLEVIAVKNTSGRTYIWKALLGRFFNDNFASILFGRGIGTTAYYNTFDHHVAHNAFIDILIGTGILGLLCYIAIYALMLKKAWRSKNFAMVVVMVGFIVMSMSLSLTTYKPIFNAFLYIGIYSRTYQRKGMENANRVVTKGAK